MQILPPEEKRSPPVNGASWWRNWWPWLLVAAVPVTLFIAGWVLHVSRIQRQVVPPVSLKPHGLSAFDAWIDCPRWLNCSDTGKESKSITVYLRMVVSSDVESLEFVIRSSPANVVRFVDRDGRSVSSPPHLRFTPAMDQNIARHLHIAHANTEEADRANKADFTISVITTLPERVEKKIDELGFAVKVEGRSGMVLRNFFEGNLTPLLIIIPWIIAIGNKVKKWKSGKKSARVEQRAIVVNIILTSVVLVVFLWPQPPAPIKIGVEGPLTGPLAPYGRGCLNAVTLLVDQINDKGGLLDNRKIKIVEVDDMGNPSEAVRAANKLVEEDVVAVIGSIQSSATETAAAIYDEANVLHITPSATTPQLRTKGYDKFFRLAFPDDRQSLFAATFMARTLHTQKAAVIHDNSPYTKDLAYWARIYLEKQGTNVITIETMDPWTVDTRLMSKLAFAAPDAVYLAAYPPCVANMLLQSSEAGVESTWIVPFDPHHLDWIATVGPDVTTGVYFIGDPGPEDIVSPKIKTFSEDFKAKYGDPPPDISWVRAADASRLIADAIDAKHSISAEMLADYIRNIRDFSGISGTIIGFDDKGDRLGTDYVVYVTDENGNLQRYQQP